MEGTSYCTKTLRLEDLQRHPLQPLSEKQGHEANEQDRRSQSWHPGHDALRHSELQNALEQLRSRERCRHEDIGCVHWNWPGVSGMLDSARGFEVLQQSQRGAQTTLQNGNDVLE